MSAPTSSFRKAWLKWKSIRLPWRKRFLVGLDLQGNTYWEFRDTLSPGRMRRIVDYPSSVQYSDVSSHITPAWHQWLRHTRKEAPTLAEQELDVLRQRRVKVLAAQADERWEAKGRLTGGPSMRQMAPGLGMGDATATGKPETAGTAGIDSGEATRGGGAASEGKQDTRVAEKTTTSTVGSAQDILERESERLRVNGAPGPKVYTNPGAGSRAEKTARKPPATSQPPKEDPWKKARGGPSEDWQPEAWTPGQATRR
ncbi:hypothetical protein V492_06097 [Pseudogymnoascus sp. VKM F-4246]|nr:hypothetical protein V492_06097 [Pseudogymnoascus sp. VKM F-4246]